MKAFKNVLVAVGCNCKTVRIVTRYTIALPRRRSRGLFVPLTTTMPFETVAAAGNIAKAGRPPQLLIVMPLDN